MTLRLPPLAIYVHMPWCVRKCPYCDFNSHVAPESLPEDRYIDCLLEDLRHDLPAVHDREIHSVFFGGGTPSLFTPESIRRFLDGVRAQLTFAKDVEITLEANPGTVEHGTFAGYKFAGVNRISLGVQSFDDHQLKVLGRIHYSKQVAAAVDEMAAAGFENINLDLMYGLPGQTLDGALQDLSRAIELGPTHLAQYQLALEPGTVFYHRPPKLPNEEAIWEMQLASQEKLSASGFAQYEVSAYARPSFRCRHNLNYWRFGDYFGLGAGAHGKWTDLARGISRSERYRQPREYLARPLASQRITRMDWISTDELPFEFMLN